MLRRTTLFVALGLLLVMPVAARAGFTQQSDDALTRVAAGTDYVEAHQYRLPDSRVPGSESTRQSVTAFEVTEGSWNGEKLGGLSLVLVKSIAEDGRVAATINCYISHLATPAQRAALVNAFMASQAIRAADAKSWRMEPAVIRLEMEGKTVIVHLGLVA